MRNRIVVLIRVVPASHHHLGPQQSAPQNMPGMNMPGHDMSNLHAKDMDMSADKDADKDSDASAHAMHSMEGHMDMGPHMKMTALRPPRPGDAARAQEVVESARKASEKYLDYHVALAEGFKIFHPEVPQKMYHFTNYGYAMEAAFRFNPEHPTSLLYEKHGEDYKLIGVMYTAPKRFGEDQLDQRVPLSVAQWHEHVNFCAAPPGSTTAKGSRPIRNSAYEDRSPRRKLAMPQAEHFIPWSSTGWSTSTPLKKTKPASGRSAVSTATRD